ncbi:hypothetical protein KTR9_2814 [Gordonia sp. KTR9]|nr:hypothetical protein KTR9_2814 [Gordonia sp. KTR9]
MPDPRPRGVVMFTRYLDVDHAHKGIRRNAVCPGLVNFELGGVKQAYELEGPVDRRLGGLPIRSSIPKAPRSQLDTSHHRACGRGHHIAARGEIMNDGFSWHYGIRRRRHRVNRSGAAK